MIAFTILGLLVFWCWCFQVGYWLIPGTQAAWTLLLMGRTAKQMDAVAAVIAARHSHTGEER